MVYAIRFVLDSWLKQSTGQGSTLPEDQRQFIKARTEIPIAGIQAVKNTHFQVTLGRDALGKQIFFKGRNTWFVYKSDIQLLKNGVPVSLPTGSAVPSPVSTPVPVPTPTPTPVPTASEWVLKAVSDTWLKQSTAPGSSLAPDQRQLIQNNTVFPISGYAPVSDNHLKVTLGVDNQGKQLFIKGLTTWFVFRPDVQILRDGKVVLYGSAPTPTPAPTPKPAPTPEVKHINAKGLQLLKNFEGLSLTAYKDAVGIWTIGYGTTSGVKPGQKITQAQAEEFLKRDLQRFEAAVDRLVKVPLNSNQFSALVVFTYNAGERALATSTLLKLLNQGHYQAAADQLLRWNRAGGQVLAGLTRRRQAERALFLS
ncbi:MAG: lysozyme [Oculatellaceae cyanobacterium bins.114]|nr:lysozyme [Oculatellaceae cyanobacterium bins.114]